MITKNKTISLKELLLNNGYDIDFITKERMLEFFEVYDKQESDYISPTEFLNDYDWSYIDEVEQSEIKNINSDLEIIRESNTYNYCGYAKNEINYLIVKDNENDICYFLFSFHVGMDIRSGYTDYLIFKAYDDYDILCLLNQPFGIKEVEYNNNTYIVDGSLTSEYISIYNTDTNDSFECFIDISDNDNIISEIKNHENIK